MRIVVRRNDHGWVPRSPELPSVRVEADLRRRLVGGEWSSGDALPTVAEFAEHYGVARALRVLAGEDLVRIVARWGTFKTQVSGLGCFPISVVAVAAWRAQACVMSGFGQFDVPNEKHDHSSESGRKPVFSPEVSLDNAEGKPPFVVKTAHGRTGLPLREGSGFPPDVNGSPEARTDRDDRIGGADAAGEGRADGGADLPPDGDRVSDTGDEGRRGEHGGGGDSDSNRAREAPRYTKEVIRAYDQGRAVLEELKEAHPEQGERVRLLEESFDVIMPEVEQVSQGGPGQPPGPAFQLMQDHADLVDDVRDAEEAAQGAGRGFWERLKRWLGRAGRKLWGMISHLVAVKEWSVSGTVGTGVLGLAEASISVTFG